MEFSVLLHLVVGVYMLTNQDIFSTVVNEDRSEVLFAFTEAVIYPVAWTFGLEEERFQTDHAMLYICGIALFLVFFLLERFFGLFKIIVDWCCCMEDDDIEETFCSNIFEEMSLEDQFHEFL